MDSFGLHPDCLALNGERLSGRNWASWDTPVEVLMPRFMVDGKPDLDALFPAMAKMMDESRSYECLTRHGLFDGFIEAMETLHSRGFTPTILTDNTPEGIQSLGRFLAEQGLGWMQVEMAKMGQPKIDWCHANNVTVLVDDAPKTILAGAAADPKVTVVALRYLYNADAIAETGFPSASNWHDLLPLIERALGVGDAVAA